MIDEFDKITAFPSNPSKIKPSKKRMKREREREREIMLIIIHRMFSLIK